MTSSRNHRAPPSYPLSRYHGYPDPYPVLPRVTPCVLQEAEIKVAAKRGDTVTAKTLAKQLIRIRAQKEKNLKVSATVTGVSHQTTVTPPCPLPPAPAPVLTLFLVLTTSVGDAV